MGGALVHTTNALAPNHQLSAESLFNSNNKNSVKAKFVELSRSQKAPNGNSVRNSGITGNDFAAKFGFPIKIQKPIDSIERYDTGIHDKFHEECQNQVEDSSLRLSKVKVLELVKWILKSSRDTRRSTEIVNVFINCLEGDLDFEEFCLMYEGIATRVELEICFDRKFIQLDVHHTGYLGKQQIIEMINYILSEMAQVWCNKSETTEMKKRMISLFQDEKSKMSQLELYEIFDSMLVTIRLIHMAKKKFKEYDVDKNGVLNEDEIVKLSEWILKSYERNGVQIKEEDKKALKELIFENYDLNHSGVLGVREISLLFESIMEKKRWFHTLNTMAVSRYAMAPTSISKMSTKQSAKHPNTNHHTNNNAISGANATNNGQGGRYPSFKSKNRRLSSQTDLTQGQLAAIGLTPGVKEKFLELGSPSRKGLSQIEVMQLLEWIYRRRKSQLSSYKAEFEKEWEQEVVTYEEFCSMYEDATMRIELMKTFDKTFEALSLQKGKQTLLDLKKLKDLVDISLPTASFMGCTEEERLIAIDHVLDDHINLVTLRVGFATREELCDLYEDICSTSRLFKNVGVIFNELDKNESGALEGEEELYAMALSIIQLSSSASNSTTSTTFEPSIVEVHFMRDQILTRFGKDLTGAITIAEYAFVHDDILKKKRQDFSTARYKMQVKQLLVNLLATSSSSHLDTTTSPELPLLPSAREEN